MQKAYAHCRSRAPARDGGGRSAAVGAIMVTHAASDQIAKVVEAFPKAIRRQVELYRSGTTGCEQAAG